MRAMPREDVEGLFEGFAAGMSEPFDRMKLRYLKEWLAESPEDPYLKRELLSIFVRGRSDPRRDEEHEAAMERFMADLGRLNGALREFRASCEALRLGREAEALRRRKEALKICEVCVRRGLGGESVPEAPDEATALRRDCGRTPKPNLAAWWFFGRLEESTRLVDAGVALYHQGRRDEAVSSFREALELDGENISAWLSLGAALHGVGRHPEAIAVYDKMLSRGLQGNVRADILAAKANTLWTLGRKAQAKRARTEAIEAADLSWPHLKELQEMVGQ